MSLFALQIALGFAALLFASVIVVGLIFIARASKPFDDCGLCGDPLVLGFTAIHEGKYVCRDCCRKHDIPPWYAKKLPG